MNKLLAIIAITFKLVLADKDICYQDDVEIRYCEQGYKCCNVNQCCRDYGALWWLYVIIVIAVLLLSIFFYKIKCFSCCKTKKQANSNQQAPLLQSHNQIQNSNEFRAFQGNPISLQGNNNQQNNDNNV
ncbi:hypothetical protein ABPG74_020378 [Tetrahymena malaccensis]